MTYMPAGVCPRRWLQAPRGRSLPGLPRADAVFTASNFYGLPEAVAARHGHRLVVSYAARAAAAAAEHPAYKLDNHSACVVVAAAAPVRAAHAALPAGKSRVCLRLAEPVHYGGHLGRGERAPAPVVSKPCEFVGKRPAAVYPRMQPFPRRR